MDEKRQSWLFALIVFLSGVAGLSYQLIWIRTIKGYFGSELFSMSLVVSIYFAGMGLGGLLGSRLLKRGWAPIGRLGPFGTDAG
jgi:spermidine synthase